MQKCFHLRMFITVLALTVCVGNAKFPASSMVPAADILGTQRANRQKLCTTEHAAMNLAAPVRLLPSRTHCLYWNVTKVHGVKIIGRLHVKNAETTSCKSITAFNFYKVIMMESGKAIQITQAAMKPVELAGRHEV